VFVRAVRLSLLSVVGVLLLAGLAGAASPMQADLVSTEFSARVVKHRFVTLGAFDGHPGLRITAATKRRYRERWIASRCVTLGQDDPITFGGWGGDTAPLHTTTWLWVGRFSDYCQVQITIRRVRHRRLKVGTETVRTTRHLRQTIVVTAAGRAYVARVRAASRMFAGIVLASLAYDRKAHRYPLASDLLAKSSWATGEGLVAGASADAVPPKGKVGLWTDGLHRVRVTFVLPDGTLLYHDSDDASHALSTNVQGEIDDANAPDGWWADTYALSSSSSSASRR